MTHLTATAAPRVRFAERPEAPMRFTTVPNLVTLVRTVGAVVLAVIASWRRAGRC